MSSSVLTRHAKDISSCDAYQVESAATWKPIGSIVEISLSSPANLRMAGMRILLAFAPMTAFLDPWSGTASRPDTSTTWCEIRRKKLSFREAQKSARRIMMQIERARSLANAAEVEFHTRLEAFE